MLRLLSRERTKVFVKMKSEMSSKSGRPQWHTFAAIKSYLTSRRNSQSRGSALVELAITLPVALSIVLGSVHISAVIREATIIVEAARHGARAAAAQSGVSPVNSITSVVGTPFPLGCPADVTTIGTTNPIHLAAEIAACSYIQANSHINSTEWSVATQINLRPNEGGVSIYVIDVNITANSARGPVESLKTLLNIRPTSTSIFPLMVY